MEAGGFNEKHGFEFELGSLEDKRKRATEGLLTGDFHIVSGNHHSLYARRGLHNEPFVHIGQVNNQWNQHWMVAKEGINTVADLRGKRISINKRAGHPGLNLWLYLRQNGLEDGKDLQIIDGDKKGIERVRHVMAGAFDATFIGSVDQVRAKKLGARVIDLPTFPMIEGVTLTTTTKYVNTQSGRSRRPAPLAGRRHPPFQDQEKGHARHHQRNLPRPAAHAVGRGAGNLLRRMREDLREEALPHAGSDQERLPARRA